MNNNYGMPDISVPLFEIDYHGYKIPLTLHYEASPLKPGYNYDVTGLGWTLSGNSCVSRTIMDRADEYGRFGNPFVLDSFNDKRYMDYADELDQMNFQYDSYNIVLPSGRTIPFFMYMSYGAMEYSRMYYDRDVRIVCSYGINSIDAFTVTDENGVVYHFTLADKAVNCFENDVNAERNVTWLLTSIDIPAKGTIYYDYTPLQTINTYEPVYEPVIRVSRLTTQMQEDLNEKRVRVMNNPQTRSPRYKMRFLSSISYGPTKIDLNYLPDGCHMKEIVVSESNDTIKRFTLAINGSSLYGQTLKSLVISGQGNEERLVYNFTYANSYPGSYTDYWGNRCNTNAMSDLGNFNLFIDNVGLDRTTLQTDLANNGNLAQLIENKPEDPYYYYKLKLQSTTSGDTRQPTPPQLHGVLTSITYPNGGHTSFNWENHRFPTATAADGDFVFDRRNQRIIEGGGFRIESVTNWDVDGTASTDYYRYGFTYRDIIQRNFPLPLSPLPPDYNNINTHIGCGEAVVDPNVLTFMSFSHATNITTPLEFHKMVVGLPSQFRNICKINGSASWWDACFSANTFRLLLGGRRPVVYPEITVYNGYPGEPEECISKTVYKYDIYGYGLSPSNYYLSTFNQTALPDTAYFESLFYYNGLGLRCMEEPAKRHQLKSKSDYSYNAISGTWDLISKEEYAYVEENKPMTGFVFDSDVSRGHCGNHTLALGAGRPLQSFSLIEFYQPLTRKSGRSTMCQKTTTTLRQGGTCCEDNKQTETYSYLYSGVLKEKDYTDLYYRVRDDYGGGSCDKSDVYSYVGEENGSNSVIAEMKSRNMLASLISAETFSEIPWPLAVKGSKIDYNFYGNNILPFKLYEKNGDVYEESVEVMSYESCGNPREIQDLKTGIHSVFLWDASSRYLTAMIKNATWSQVQAVASQLSGTSQSRYATLKALLPDAQIQTWDYKPLVGVSSFTDVNGRTLFYEYDGLGRLKKEKRVVNGTSQPEILHEYEYNFINQ